MAFSPAVAVYDACILYPFHLRNIVVQAAADGLVDARWTDAIHDEWMRNLLTNTPGLPAEHLAITKQLMNIALPEATVTGYEKHIETVDLGVQPYFQIIEDRFCLGLPYHSTPIWW